MAARCSLSSALWFARSVVMVIHLPLHDLVKLAQAGLQVCLVDDRAWQFERLDRSRIPCHPARRRLSVADPVRGNLQERPLPAQRRNKSQMAYELGCQSIVEPALVPSHLVPNFHDDENRADRHQLKYQANAFRSR